MQTSQRREVALDDDPDRVFTAVRDVVEQQGWTVVGLDDESRSVQFRSPRTMTSWPRSYAAGVSVGNGATTLTLSCSFDTRKAVNPADGWRNRRALGRLVTAVSQRLAGR